MTKGLYQELAELLAKREAGKARLADPEISANERHSLNWTAGDLDREIVRLTNLICEDEVMLVQISAALETLTDFPGKTRLRSLAITDLEQAHDRLRRELGDPIKQP